MNATNVRFQLSYILVRTNPGEKAHAKIRRRHKIRPRITIVPCRKKLVHSAHHVLQDVGINSVSVNGSRISP